MLHLSLQAFSLFFVIRKWRCRPPYITCSLGGLPVLGAEIVAVRNPPMYHVYGLYNTFDVYVLYPLNMLFGDY